MNWYSQQELQIQENTSKRRQRKEVSKQNNKDDIQKVAREIQIETIGLDENIIVSFVLLSIQYLQLIYLSFYNIDILLDNNHSFTNNIINAFKNFTSFFMIKPLLDQFISGTSNFVGSFGSIIHYSFYSVIFTKLFINLPKELDHNIAQIMSFTMKCYIYVLFAPIFTSLVDYSSFTIDNVPSIFISVFMGVIIILHDFNFSFAPTDFLSKKVNSIGFVQFFGNCFIMAFYQDKGAQPFIFTLQIVLSAIVANHVLNGMIFFDHIIEQFNFILMQYFFQLQILQNYLSTLSYILIKQVKVFLLLSVILEILKQSNLNFYLLIKFQLIFYIIFLYIRLVNITMNFCLLFMRVLGEQNIAIPFLILSSVVFSFRLGTEFYERKVQKILNMSIDKIETSEQLEQYVRANLMKKEDLNLENYYSSKLGIIFEGLKVEHKVDCTKKSCFCRRYESMEQHKKQDCKEKKRFLIKFLDKVFEKHLKKRKKDKNFDKNFLIIYCSFIIEILRCPIKSYVYLLQLEQDKDLQTLEQRVLSFLLQRKAQTQFEQYFKFDEDYNFESALQFCEQMEQFKDTYKKLLLSQRQFYVSIGQEHIDLNKFYIFCFNQINERNNVEKDIQNLFYVNRKSQKLQQYAFIYANVFDLKRQKFKKNLSNIYKKIYLKQIKTVQKSYSLFHKDTGAVFVSLLQPIGKIQRASRNFLKIFGYF